MIKATIFDFGNVICNFDNNIFIERISKYTEKSKQELHEIIFNSSELMKKYETGLISSEEFFNEAVERCSLSITKQEFIKAFTDIFTPIPTTFELIKKLKKRYKIALLSNTNEWDFEYGIKTTEIFPLFDAVTLSFEVKSKKPEEKIYRDVLNKLKLKPEECVFIDDIQEFVESANKIGMRGIHYTSYEKLIESLKNLKVSFD